MPRLKWGTPKHPGKLTFEHRGYWFISDGEEKQFVPYSEPKEQHHKIQKWYGLTVGGLFIGVILTKSV